MKKSVLIIILLSIFSVFCFSEEEELLHPLIPEIISAVPLKGEYNEFKVQKEENGIIVSIKEDNTIHFWRFNKNSLEMGKLRELKLFPLKEKRKNYRLVRKKRKLIFYLKNRKKWVRKSPALDILDYVFNGKFIGVLFKNGFFNVFLKGGDLIFWKVVSPESFKIIGVKKGFFIFSEKKYYFFNFKKKELKEGNFNLRVRGNPIILKDRIIIWGSKDKEKFFAMEKMKSKIGVFFKIDKNDYFKGESVKLTIKIYNVEKVRTTVITVFEGKENLVYKNSDKKEFKIYLPFEGINYLKVLIKGKDYKKEKKFKIKVIDREKVEGEIFYELLDKIIIRGEI